MNYREIELLGPTYLGTAGTKIIDVDIPDVLSSLELIWRTTVATVSDMTAPHVACLSRIEIVDGSDVLFSLTGEETQAMHFYATGKMPLNNISVVVADYMESVLPIYFGRHLYDTNLAFDPKKFTNPQLRITFDQDAANASVVVNELTVRGWAFDQKVPTPRGFLMSKEIKSFTPVLNTFEYTDLPTDHPYRLILIRSKSDDKNPYEVLSQVKISEDHDKRVPINMTGYEIFRKISQPLGRISQKVRLNETAADAMALYLAPTYLQDGQIDYDLDTSAAGDDYGQITYANNIVTIEATVAVIPYLLSLAGYAPHSCFAIPLGILDDPADWYDVTRLAHLRVITQGAAAVGATPSAQICLQQYRSY